MHTRSFPFYHLHQADERYVWRYFTAFNMTLKKFSMYTSERSEVEGDPHTALLCSEGKVG